MRINHAKTLITPKKLTEILIFLKLDILQKLESEEIVNFSTSAYFWSSFVREFNHLLIMNGNV